MKTNFPNSNWNPNSPRASHTDCVTHDSSNLFTTIPPQTSILPASDIYCGKGLYYNKYIPEGVLKGSTSNQYGTIRK
jgi:hypothetical protein